MREIKFRGKRLDNGEWIYGNYVSNECGNHFIIQVYDEDNIVFNRHEVDPSTIGQYTRLKDSQGVEIYEGDMLGSNIYSRKWALDSLEDLRGFYYWFTELGIDDDLKVIGNIHEEV